MLDTGVMKLVARRHRRARRRCQVKLTRVLRWWVRSEEGRRVGHRKIRLLLLGHRLLPLSNTAVNHEFIENKGELLALVRSCQMVERAASADDFFTQTDTQHHIARRTASQPASSKGRLRACGNMLGRAATIPTAIVLRFHAQAPQKHSRQASYSNHDASRLP